jgi:hypothetical protein
MRQIIMVCAGWAVLLCLWASSPAFAASEAPAAPPTSPTIDPKMPGLSPIGPVEREVRYAAVPRPLPADVPGKPLETERPAAFTEQAGPAPQADYRAPPAAQLLPPPGPGNYAPPAAQPAPTPQRRSIEPETAALARPSAAELHAPATQTAAAPAADPPRSWWLLTLVSALLAASLGGNVYLAWVVRGVYQRYQDLVAKQGLGTGN